MAPLMNMQPIKVWAELRDEVDQFCVNLHAICYNKRSAGHSQAEADTLYLADDLAKADALFVLRWLNEGHPFPRFEELQLIIRCEEEPEELLGYEEEM